MDSLDVSEKNGKVSDSAYSNSCSNSQSRRSHSSKSTHSGSNSSGSSGYGGKPSTSGSSYNLGQSQKREKETKKKTSQSQSEIKTDVKTDIENTPQEITPKYDTPKEEQKDVVEVLPAIVQDEKGPENIDISSPDHNSSKEEVVSGNAPIVSVSVDFVTSRPAPTFCSDGFSCVISMEDGVVMYTSSSLTATLGFPKDLWIGRSFIDFLHPRDRNTFASQITNNLVVPKIVNGTQEKGQFQRNSQSTMVCRIRRYRGITSGFGVKEQVITFAPFLLKLTFKNVKDEVGDATYLVVRATPFLSAFRMPNETLSKSVPFVIRHSASGNLEYIDPESVPYLGYLPQDVTDKDALQLYHPDDLHYLRQVYEIIVKEGALPRSKPCRLMTQNGDYIKVVTEWSSFINPWSKKLEFVIGKHHIIEGPNNPDVFQSPDPEKCFKLSEEEKCKANMIRESIIGVMNKALTKPAGIAKQQMSKICQDLTSFMESLVEEPPKTDDYFRIEIQDPDNSCERDSVMLGGISPHHDYNDSKSSTETPLSYNQLNYNETLHRYFESHQPFSYEESDTIADEKILGLKHPDNSTSKCVTPLVNNSCDTGGIDGPRDSISPVVATMPIDTSSNEYQQLRLTESLLNKHNAEMEKELMKMHRETTRSDSKVTRVKVYSDIKKKTKEQNTARCSASYYNTSLPTVTSDEVQAPVKGHGTKRSMKYEPESCTPKHHCSPGRSPRRKSITQNTSAPAALSSSTLTTSIANNQWPTNSMNNLNTFILGVGIPQQMSLVSAVPTAMPGMFPVYYTPSVTAGPSTSSHAATNTSTAMASGPAHQFTPNSMQCMMYGQPVYGSPFMYSPFGLQMPYSMGQRVMPETNLNLNPLGLPTSTYLESTEMAPKKSVSNKSKNSVRLGNSDEAVDRTDGESSYSSFYSSFFKTDSGSAEESGDSKKKSKFQRIRFWNRTPCSEEADPSYYGSRKTNSCYEPQFCKKVAKRKMAPPWMEQVCVTSELIYKYQVHTKSMDEVLLADKKKIMEMEQPTLVNEQLGQLYLDLQLEDVAARLTLDEGITSSSSSGEETTVKPTRSHRRKRGYSKLVMIYEEDAPLPSSPDEDVLNPTPSGSTSYNII